MITEIGLHRVKNGDVMNGVDDLMNGVIADIIYSDPPWGIGNLGYWKTIDKRMNKDEATDARNVTLQEFIENIFSIGQKYTKNLMLIEYGCKWRDELISIANAYGFVSVAIGDLLYKSGSKLLPMDLHIFAKDKSTLLPDNYINNLKHSYGYDCLTKTLSPLIAPNDIILDPCCGMGYTAKCAVENGATFYGNELNKKRLSKTIEKLSK